MMPPLEAAYGWLGRPPTGQRVTWRVIIFFPWDPEAKLFTGERIYAFFPDGDDVL